MEQNSPHGHTPSMFKGPSCACVLTNFPPSFGGKTCCTAERERGELSIETCISVVRAALEWTVYSVRKKLVLHYHLHVSVSSGNIS